MRRGYEFHYDAGHGWLKVPARAVVAAGCKVSRYSYLGPKHGPADLDRYVYLEEDCDAPRFDAAVGRGERERALDTVHDDGPHSPIRGYERVGAFDFLGATPPEVSGDHPPYREFPGDES